MVRPCVVLKRLMSGSSVIDDTCREKEKQKGDTWESCVTPLKEDQAGWIRTDKGKKEKRERKRKDRARKRKREKKMGEERRSG